MVIKSKKSKKKKAPTVSQLKRKADAVFSQYVRLSAADHSGLSTCVTCGVSKPWEEMQCGHYEKRSANSLRFSERNCHVQCVGCNVFKGGNYPRYAQFMVQKYGQSILAELEEESKRIKQFKTYELSDIIETYKDKLSQLT